MKDRRTKEQNALMWSRLTDIANQVEWPVDGKERLISPDDWKQILTAGLTKVQRVAQGIEGGFVILGARTSKMTVSQMTELLDFISWFGNEKGVRWTIDTDA